MPPRAEPAANSRVTSQSICTSVPIRANRLAAVAMIITSRLVPEARRIARPRAITSIGTTMNPPPTPKKPVSPPVRVAVRITTDSRGLLPVDAQQPPTVGQPTGEGRRQDHHRQSGAAARRRAERQLGLAVVDVDPVGPLDGVQTGL